MLPHGVLHLVMPSSFHNVLLHILLLCFARFVAPQQSSPLEGNNPWGPPSENSSTPVYVNIVFTKLLSVDAVNYRFEVQMDVVLSWKDSRLPSIWDVSEIERRSLSVSYESSKRLCLKEAQSWLVAQQAGNTSASLSKDAESSCMNASSLSASSCERYCSPGINPNCCDDVWLPDLKFQNIVFLSQDRPVSDQIQALYPPVGSNSTTAVMRIVKVQATFTAELLFKKFPFDKQTLKMVVGSPRTGAGFHLIASGIVKDASSGFSMEDVSKSDEVPAWKIDKLQLRCKEDGEDSLVPQNFEEQAQNTDDPLYQYKLPASPSTGRHSICTIEIFISRRSQFYFWNAMFPLFLTTHLSFLVFFVNPSNLDLRLSSVMTVFLAVTALQFTINTGLPETSDVTSFHKVLIICYILVVLCGLESILVNHISQKKEKLERLGRSRHSPPQKQSTIEEDIQLALADMNDDESTEDRESEVPGTENTNTERGLSRRSVQVISSIRKTMQSNIVRLSSDDSHAFLVALRVDMACLWLFIVTFWMSTYFTMLNHA